MEPGAVQNSTEGVQSSTELQPAGHPHELADHPGERMAAPAEQEGQAMKSEVAGEQATSEHRILPRGAYQISRKNKYRPLRASEHEREREIRDTTSCVVGRSEWSYYGKDDDHEVNHESTDEEYSSDNEYESVPCTDAGRQFPNRPY